MGETGLGKAFFSIRATLDKLDGDLEGARQKVEGAMNKIGKVALAGLAAGLLGLGAAFAGLGNFAFQAGKTIDAAYDGIRSSTGATGERLDDLQKSFNDVFASVPADAEVVTDVIATLGARTAMTGQEITDLGISLTQLAEITGGDAKTQTELYTRVLGDWSIANEDAATTLDMVFSASQATGTSVDSLMSSVVQFGSPLRLMGFSLEESISLFGKWEKEGVNSELVMGSLRIAAGKFAAEGKPLRESLLATFDAIKSNTNESEALAMAMDIFGARAGPDMAAAIREGRFELGDLATALQDSEGAINDTMWATADFGEKMTLLKNRATLALEPIGTAMLDVAGKVMDFLLPAFDKLLPTIEQVSGIVAGAIGSFVDFVGKIANGNDPIESLADLITEIGAAFGMSSIEAGNLTNTIMGVIEQVQGAITSIQDFLEPILVFIASNVQASDVLIALGAAIATVVIPAIASVIAAAAPLIAVFVGVIAVVALVRTAWEENWGGIQQKTAAAWEQIRPLLEQLWTWLQINVPLALEALRVFWVDTAWPAIQNAIAVAWPVIEAIFVSVRDWIIGTLIPTIKIWYVQWTTVWWPQIQQTMEIVWPVIEAIFKELKDFVINTLIPTIKNWHAEWQDRWTKIQQVIDTIWPVIKTTFEAIVSFVVDTLIPTIQNLYAKWQENWTSIKTVLTNVWTPIEGIFKELGRWVNDNIVPWIEDLYEQWTTIWWPQIQKAIEDMWRVVEPIWKGFEEWLEKKLPRIIQEIQTKFEEVMNAISNAVSPVKDMWGGFTGAVSDFWSWISSHTFTFKISLPDLPDWAIPGSPLPIHTAWKNFAEDADRIFPTLNAGMLAQIPVNDATSSISNAYQYTIQAATPLATSDELAREVRLLEMMHQ